MTCIGWNSTMRAIDASSLIYAWDNYPLSHFPRLWEWLSDEIEKGELYTPNVAFIEVGHKVPDCSAWLVECECTVAKETHQILNAALAIRHVLGIQNDKYHPNGVDEND